MKVLYLDLSMGAAGDMLAGALYELLDEDKRAAFITRLNALGLEGVAVHADKSVKCGIVGTHFSVSVNGEEEASLDEHEHHREHEHNHEHEHEHNHDHKHEHEHEHEHHHEHEHEHEHEHHHEHHHAHRGMGEIGEIVAKLELSEKVRENVKCVYSLIADAESRVHGVPVDKIHFHEVGALDAVADIAAVCLLMELIAPDKVLASPVHVGSGRVRCAHGVLPVPAPATEELLRGVPSYGGRIEGELCTPTGAALVKHFAEGFSPRPAMAVEKTGYGMGKKDFEYANCVRALLGETAEAARSMIELACNVDDMTAEQIAFAAEMLFESGARDVFTEPVGMKKSRPGTMITVIADEEKRETLVRAMLLYTTTLGVREYSFVRHELKRETIALETPFGAVKKKLSSGFGVTKEKLEYEDIASIAREKGLSLADAVKLIEGK